MDSRGPAGIFGTSELKRSLFLVEVHDFGLLRPAVSEMQPNQCLDLLEALTAGRTGIHEQHPVQIRYAFYLKDVTVTAHKYIGRILGQLFAHPALPSSWSSRDVRHPESDTGHLESVVFRVWVPQIPSVHIAPNGANRSDGFQFIDDVDGSYIPPVENQVDVLEIVMDVRVQPAMGIRKDA